jgi:prolyl-tRNA synthetase
MKTFADVAAFYAGGGIGFCKVDSTLSEKDPEGFKKLRVDHAITNRCLPFEDEGRTVLLGKSY